MIYIALGHSINFKITSRFLLRQSVFSENQNFNIFLIFYSINHYIIELFPTAVEVDYFGARVTYKIPRNEVRNLSEVFNQLEKGTVLGA